MIQDIAPHKYHVEFEPCKPSENDIALIFKGNELLIREENGRTWFPSVGELETSGEMSFLFKMDETNLFMTEVEESCEYDGWRFVGQEYFRAAFPMWKAFAGATAIQFRRWYGENKFCSRCGGSMTRSLKERALICDSCGKTVYPSISPCVIVALTDGDKLLLTKYNQKHSKYTRYALIAGYTEVGETFEDTVKREVMEEVGLKVKNITYYKNQPWSFSDTILMGYYAEVEGSREIIKDDDELSEAVWLKRGDIPESTSEISLTNEMIERFRLNL
jgi:NAD+ diphosphatase